MKVQVTLANNYPDFNCDVPCANAHKESDIAKTCEIAGGADALRYARQRTEQVWRSGDDTGAVCA